MGSRLTIDMLSIRHFWENRPCDKMKLSQIHVKRRWMFMLASVVVIIAVIVIYKLFIAAPADKQNAATASSSSVHSKNLRSQFSQLLRDPKQVHQLIDRDTAGVFAACLCLYVRDKFYSRQEELLSLREIAKHVEHVFPEREELSKLLVLANEQGKLHFQDGTVDLEDMDLEDELQRLFTLFQRKGTWTS